MNVAVKNVQFDARTMRWVDVASVLGVVARNDNDLPQQLRDEMLKASAALVRVVEMVDVA